MTKTWIAAVAILTVGASLTASLPTFAAAGTGQAAGQQGEKMKKLAAALNLTDAQKEQIKPILKSAREQAKAVKQDTTLTPEQQKSKLRDIRKDTMQQVGAILTPDQRAKLKAMRQNRKNGDND